MPTKLVDELLGDSIYRSCFPEQLITHLESSSLKDASVNYVPPLIDTPPITYRKKETFRTRPTDVRIPARLANALIPYPIELHEISLGVDKFPRDSVHGHHYSQLDTLRTVCRTLEASSLIPTAKLVFDMDSLKRFARQKYSQREKLINLATLGFARRATSHDLSIAADAKVDFNPYTKGISEYTSFVIMIQRLRIHIAKETAFPTFSPESFASTQGEATYTMFSNGTYVYGTKCVDHHYFIIACGGHFRMYHSQLDYWFCGPTSYLDYIFTVSDVLNNLDVLRNCIEYQWAEPMFNLLINFAEHEGHHKEQVDFMKGLEGFLLNMSDYDEDHSMNWRPILEAVRDLWELDIVVSGVKYDIGLVICLLRSNSYHYPKESYLCRFVVEGMKLSRTHRQEISALHKLIFYAEVNARAGIDKFLKRVHTPRVIDKNAVENITRFAKMSFCIAYKKKHGSIPNMIGPPQKIKMIEMYTNKSDYSRLETLSLTWWDDVRIFDCMDNTLTDDPLEFAKDKGALKSDISFGPGDSRKELLQVIERPDYELKDFFAKRKIAPRPPKVINTTQKMHAVPMSDPARLIEKEREQKYEARLFANAELENKHSLSLVAARMKKALAYFDEQLMTPTDKKRKALIHDASRELAQPDTYSLLLDIEGHNQSMQHANTASLAEFIGNLFGFEGWGDLGHYFGSLTVFHYDEYLDNVIESHGQLGGIEGWLNPLWTLHTTIMMKLLRIMTDLDVKKIMVYSDDVNAILKIRQASEPMVQSVFSKVMDHCSKFGMTVKYSQTTLSKHRITMLRQHYSDGIRADSTLKRLVSISAANNPVIVADELEVSGICSSASSAMELSNHNEACSYLKNYKLGLLSARLPQMLLSRVHENSMLSPEELPQALSTLLYYRKEDSRELDLESNPELLQGATNDIAAYLKRNSHQLTGDLLSSALSGVYGESIAESRMVDSPDRLLYLQIYSEFLQDLLFYWIYSPTSQGGLGASLHINLILSGHSIGLSKALHYLHKWTHSLSSDPGYFLKYFSIGQGIDMDNAKNLIETRLISSNWPGEFRICSAITSVQQAIKNMVRKHTRNKKVLEMFDLSAEMPVIESALLEIFRNNFHPRIAQFYYENTAAHFIDLLINKIETSSGLLSKVRNLQRLRNSLCMRMIENLRMGAVTNRTVVEDCTATTDVIQLLLRRKVLMFPAVKMVDVEEVLYDDKMIETEMRRSLLTIRRCSPSHYKNGVRVYDDPKVGNETLYKGELIDDDRMLGHKEELLAAKVVAVTKWFLMKSGDFVKGPDHFKSLDVVTACNVTLSTLVTQDFSDLFMYAPTETGGEILHRIPNLRFSTATYIRSEMNRTLHYTSDLNQEMITKMGLVDSNINFDYLRMRYIIAAVIRDKYPSLRRLVIRYNFDRLTGIKDVQFVSPMQTSYIWKNTVTCYSKLRSHELSQMRFRYLSHSYMYTENMNEWALMPKLLESETAEQLGRKYVNDIILRYSKDLDKDYMMISPQRIDRHLWIPLTEKLYRIDPNWKLRPQLSDEEELRLRLIEVMEERSRISLVDKSNRVHVALQEQCMDRIIDLAPDDTEYMRLSMSYRKMVQGRRSSGKLNQRLAQYQNLLTQFSEHKYKLAKSLIHEYIITYHFKCKSSNYEIVVDTEESVREFLEHDLGKFSLMVINPELQARLLILGMEYVEHVINTYNADILEEFREICSEANFADIVMPVSLPSLGAMTTLTGDETLSDSMYSIEYIMHEIPASAMATLPDLEPLCKFAQKCAITGADPETFTSPTGSDSLGAQFGLFRAMMSAGVIDQETRICDLTAGRGDGLYAARELSLNVTSYSKEDTFTRLDYHPGINFMKDYDIFDGSTLKFITGFEHVHVDVSFTSASESSIIDLVLLLEESNVSYSIRLNSVHCHGYTEDRLLGMTSYQHRLAFAMSTPMKPYQIYLIGTPSGKRYKWGAESMKSTMAFKAMVLGFSALLSPRHQLLRLEGFRPNSASLYMPSGRTSDEFITKVCDDSILSEQCYYLDRYLSEMGPGAVLEFSYNHLTDLGQKVVNDRTRIFSIGTVTSYSALSPDHIGNVSEKARPHHQTHVKALMDGSTPVWSADFENCDEILLQHFRTHHPLQEIRTWCNIMLGLHKFCRAALLSGHQALEDLRTSLSSKGSMKTSMHQKELSTAVKLLVLAARDDNYRHGVAYCRNLLQVTSRSTKSTIRTLRCYRLLSYLFDDIKRLMSRGEICIRSILAIENDLEVREPAKVKYKKTSVRDSEPSVEDLAIGKFIEDSMDDIFASLERYAADLDKRVVTEESISTDEDVIKETDLHFDIGITNRVNQMVAQLGLKPSGPHGFIDLGDEIPDDSEEWWD
nr:RNA-dependent RNA polymerase [Actinidia fungus negative-stranded RNA virus 1]